MLLSSFSRVYCQRSGSVVSWRRGFATTALSYSLSNENSVQGTVLQAAHAQVIQSASRVFPQLGQETLMDCKHSVSVSRHTASDGEVDNQLHDVQSNCAFLLGRHLGLPPQQVAEALAIDITGSPVDGSRPSVFARAVAHPRGFLNLRLSSAWLCARVVDQPGDLRRTRKPRRICIDSGGPNVGKQLHVGHLRSAIIGQALHNVFNYLGDSTQCVSHVGDFGAPVGLILTELTNATDQKPFEKGSSGNSVSSADHHQQQLDRLSTIEKIDSLYVGAVQRQKNRQLSKEQQVQAQRAVLAIQRHCINTKKKMTVDQKWLVNCWKTICRVSRESYEPVFRRLGVWGDMVERPESSYAPLIPGVLNTLGTGLPAAAYERNGQSKARVAFAVDRAPLMLRSSVGAYLYGMTDLAAIYQRLCVDEYDLVVYVTDSAQSLHFQQVFELARLMNWLDGERVAVHAPFGVVKGMDGRKLSSRQGDVPRLSGLLDLAVQRAAAVREQLPSADPDPAADEVVGCSALKFFDLSHERTSAYQFSLDRMLDLKGKSAVYCLYTHARVSSILEKLDSSATLVARNDAFASFDDQLIPEEERQLLVQLSLFHDCLLHVERDLSLHALCDYLYDLCRAFNAFYSRCPIIAASNAEGVRQRREFLCVHSQQKISTCLSLLGIPSLKKM